MASNDYPWGGANPWETAPIHLMQLLGPSLSMTGYAPGCMFTWPGYQRADPPAPILLSYPGEGTRFIYARERASESPFVPGEFVGLGSGALTGPHLYVLAWGAGSGQITSASLTGPAGPVAVKTVDNTTRGSRGNLGGYLPAGGMIIPVAPLAPGSIYTASVTFQPLGAAALSLTWGFATAIAENNIWLSAPPRRRATRGHPAHEGRKGHDRHQRAQRWSETHGCERP